MASLHQVVAALRREIDSALKEDSAPNCRIQLEPDRVVLSLEVSIREEGGPTGPLELSFEVPGTRPSAGERQTHRLTFEFKSTPRSSSQDALKPAAGKRQSDVAPTNIFRLDGAEGERAIKTLSSVFGPPGFDSSARATVFREVFAALSEARRAALIASFSSGSVPDDDVVLRDARHRMQGVFRSGPLRSIERGSEIFAEVLSQYALEPVIRLLDEKWKTQQDWLGEDAGPRSNKGRRSNGAG